ncbi:putative binding protein-protein-dependent transport protein (periplasmic) [Roseibacterium elongatum DSM 19469]|uniref:Putative binding protein-protein-dependent transport protein (Periplasmic) n=1 Tax=Roseicyclus elongatus DSM 19469 TaxID=1294273 RepID=W8RTI6_9RHOB|nr:ABC transporter substrate-binding protein [Roseibacterium elongatum]AHM04529.1 putative binding protein-protein-dependent transport protein (periplasmic) [Roseibacterium elongatum DSM 19469]
MTFRVAAFGAALLATTALTAAEVSAETLRWARAAEALTLDPHSQNEGPTTTLMHQIYEPLIVRNHAGEMEAGLATSWEPSEDDPNVWVFTLREGVTFHGGEEFDSADAVFSIERAMTETSNFKELLSSVSEVRATGPYTLEIVTDGPNPLLPNNLTNIMMMDQGWAEANNAEAVQDYAAGEDTYAARNTNGTGPYVLQSREADVRTVLSANPDYWGVGEFPLAVSEIIFTPIQNPATRVAALLTGEVDFIQDVPVQDLQRVNDADGMEVITAPQNRVIFFGMNVGAEDLELDNVDGANPFADLRVRQAIDIAINREAIQQVVMRGQSEPAGVIMPPPVNGWTEELDAYPAYDIEAANALMEEAGYGDGFSVQLDCPNDRYINDEAICQATVGMLAQIGITANLSALPRAQHFPLIANGETDFYMLGWGVPTYDSEYIFNFLYHTRGEGRGSWNGTNFSDAEMDEMIVSLASEVDLDARDATIAQLWEMAEEELIYIPVHNQILNWGISDGWSTLVDADDSVKFKYFEAE